MGPYRSQGREEPELPAELPRTTKALTKLLVKKLLELEKRDLLRSNGTCCIVEPAVVASTSFAGATFSLTDGYDGKRRERELHVFLPQVKDTSDRSIDLPLSWWQYRKLNAAFERARIRRLAAFNDTAAQLQDLLRKLP